MHIDSEYERLIKEGYIEEGTLVVYVDDLTKMDLSPAEVKPDGVKGERQDKDVVVIDKQGRSKKVSSILLGKNKKQVQLGDGSFINSDELLEAIKEAVSRLDKGSIVVDKKGRALNPEDLLKIAEEAAGKIKIGGISDKVTNQEARSWSNEGANSDVEHKKGWVFLGKDKVDLKEGEYISAEEFLKALQEYMVLTPKKKEPIPPIPPIPPVKPEPEPKQPERERKPFIRVVLKIKNKLAAWLLLLAIILTPLTGFRLNDKYELQRIPEEQIIVVEQLMERDNLFYDIQGMEYEDILETAQQFRIRHASELNIGDPFYMQEGDEFYETSSLTGRKGTIGQGIRQAGNYAVTGVSIYCNGQYYGSFVDLEASKAGYNLGTFINETAAKYGLNHENLELRLHLGNSSNYTVAGWTDISSLLQEDEITPEVIGKKAVEGSTYDGEIKDFKGTTITINTLDGKVEIPVMDASGNLYEAGTTVYGSDGKEYIISGLEIVEDDVMVSDTISQTVYREEQVAVGKKLTWRIQDCNLTVAIAPLLGAIASHIATKKKNEEAEKNPVFFEFEDEAEYQKFKREFEAAKEKYEKTSGFKKMLKDVFYRKEVDLLQRLTEEQIQALYTAIRNCHNGDYSYNPNDRIEFKNGKIIITFKDGRQQDITDIIMPSIAHLGKENPYETEGRLELEEEEKNEVRTR